MSRRIIDEFTRSRVSFARESNFFMMSAHERFAVGSDLELAVATRAESRSSHARPRESSRLCGRFRAFAILRTNLALRLQFR